MLDDGSLISTRKADFTEIYGRSDPRDYYRTLHPLRYQVPQQALPVVEAALTAASRAGRPRTVLDLCCSYGVNAALLRHRVTLQELGGRYCDPDLDDLSTEELLDADRAYFAARRRRPHLPIVGLDASTPAVDYAVRAGLLSDGFGEDLETSDPSPGLGTALGGVGLVISTGGVGYIGPRTFDRLLRGVPEPSGLWLVVFVLRVFAYDEIAALLARHGLVTEKLPGTFLQRRFADNDEFEAANLDVQRRGLDVEGKEATGWYHADCFLTRPAADVAQLPADRLLAAALSGTDG